MTDQPTSNENTTNRTPSSQPDDASSRSADDPTVMEERRSVKADVDETVIQGNVSMEDVDETVIQREVSKAGVDETVIQAEVSKADVDETVIQRDVSVQDATIITARHDESQQTDDEAPTVVTSLPAARETSSADPQRTVPSALPAAEATVVTARRSPARTDFDSSADSGAPTVVGSTESGGDTEFSVAATLRAPDAEAGAQSTVPTIGRFQILKVLGQGAFGTVYLAHDPHLDRKVAIKVAKTGILPDKQDVDRFMREARSAAQLRHPHIVPVYEFERLPQSSFIAYEYIEGRTLGDLLKERKKLTCEEAAEYIGKLALALDYAHTHGIVHRDIKPENILLDQDGEPHISDFGLARRDDGDTLRTREGMFMGTPSYMSPEQASGQAYLADGRTDIWSLGVMLHEMLTGSRPFQGQVTEVLIAVQRHEPSPIRQIDKSLPKDLETICHKAMAKKLDERYRRAQDLADELTRWREGRPIQARPLSLPHRVWRWAKRNPDIAGLLGAVLATFLIGAIVSTVFGVSARRSEQGMRAARAERAQTQLAALGDAVSASVPHIIEELASYRDDISPQLDAALTAQDLSRRERARLRMAQAILGGEESAPLELADDVLPQLLDSDEQNELVANELLMLTDLVSRHGYRPHLENRLWRTSQREAGGSPRRFRALAALAALRSEATDWSRVRSDLVAKMLTMGPYELSPWLTAFRPVRDELEDPLREQFMTATDANLRVQAAFLLATLFDDSLEVLVALVPQASPDQLAPLLAALQTHRDELVQRLESQLKVLLDGWRANPHADRQPEVHLTNLAAALLSLDAPQSVWPLLRGSPDRGVRSRLIHAIPPAGVPWRRIVTRLSVETDPIALAALCLTLGEYGPGDLLPGDREELAERLLDLFATHPHAGVHAATEWTLRRWGQHETLGETKTALATNERRAERDWHLDPQGLTFAIFDGPIEFEMGAGELTPKAEQNEERHRRLIPRSFGIADREVTVEEYLKFGNESLSAEYRNFVSNNDSAMIWLSWIDAAMYCRWLSEQAGIEEREMCYPPLEDLKQARKTFGGEIKLPADLLDRTGYRLPTAAEWEYACRTGTATMWSFGNHEELLPEYAWYMENSTDRTHEVGLFKPNDGGLFDMHGNALEWCHTYYFDEYIDPAAGAEVMVDGVDSRDKNGSYREMRGASYMRPASFSSTAYREYDQSRNIGLDYGFRIARTYRTDPSKSSAD